MSILILTQSDDVHATAAQWLLRQDGLSAERWALSDFPFSDTISLNFHPDTGLSSPSTASHSLTKLQPEYVCVWCRRLSHGSLERIRHDGDRDVARSEALWFLDGLVQTLYPQYYWINPPDKAVIARSKPRQLDWAAKLGLTTPKTCMTNDPDKVQQLMAQSPNGIIHKPFEPYLWYSEEGAFATFTQSMSEEDLKDDFAIRAAPGIYQEKVAKA